MPIKLLPEMLEGIPQNGPTDPIEYYRRPLLGRLFRQRINLGLELLPEQRYGRALEVGYGAGAVQLALAPHVDELHGIDLEADPEPVRRILATRGLNSDLRSGTVYELPYPADHFDLLVSFSVFEHLAEYRGALAEARRVLKPSGLFLLGVPSVNLLMEAGFLAIGFRRINDHHVTTPKALSAAFGVSGFTRIGSAFLDVPAPRPLGVRLYYNWLLR